MAISFSGWLKDTGNDNAQDQWFRANPGRATAESPLFRQWETVADTYVTVAQQTSQTQTALDTATAEQFKPDVQDFTFDPTQTGGTVLGIESVYEGLQAPQDIKDITATEEEISALLTSSGLGQRIEDLDLQRQDLETDKSNLEAQKKARRLETYWNGSYNARRWSDQDLEIEFKPKFKQIDVQIGQIQKQIDSLKTQVRTSIEQAKQQRFQDIQGKKITGITPIREAIKGQERRDLQREALLPTADFGFGESFADFEKRTSIAQKDLQRSGTRIFR